MTALWLPFTTLPEVMLSTVAFTLGWICILYRVRTAGCSPYAGIIMKIHNHTQVLVAVYLLSSIVLATPSLAGFVASRNTTLGSICVHFQANDGFISRYSYHLSKFFEYFDIFFFVADGGEVGLHFGFHHLTTPYLTYFRWMHAYYGWQVFAALNAFHHALMYGFFAGLQGCHKFLPYTRYTQLIGGALWDAWLMVYDNDGLSQMGRAVSIFLLSCYTFLLTREIRMRRDAEKQKGN